MSAHATAPDTHTVFALFEDELEGVLSELEPAQAGFLQASGFTAKARSMVMAPQAEGALAVWYGLGARASYSPHLFRALAKQLPDGVWHLRADAVLARKAIHLAFAQGRYSFDRYKASASAPEAVQLSDSDLSDTERAELAIEVAAHRLVRDLVNTPANDMGPAEIEAAARELADSYQAQITVITGDELLAENFPAVHAVGRAAEAHRAPRFIEIDWEPHVEDLSPEPKPVVVLVGKGVAFDTGGLNIKTGAGMGLMKKDMGGAAHVLGLAQWIMASNLRVRLHVLISAVENAISGDAFRPGDVIASRAGLSIEVGNTDAEGRLILADALTRASELTPDLTIDFATLTGAARVALGPEVVPFYTCNDAVARSLEAAAIEAHDPLWRMPLWAGYKASLDSDIADIRNDAAGWAQAGSVTAALFLQRFAPQTGAWVHFDLYAWNPRAQPGRPVGAEVQTIRAVYRLIDEL
ncbi:MAG: leucyl aminopeptidase family protein [Asticcacaulis sp.]